MSIWVTFTTGPDGGGYIIPEWFAKKLIELQEEGEYEEGYPKIEWCFISADPAYGASPVDSE